jgi:hypothetical protein
MVELIMDDLVYKKPRKPYPSSGGLRERTQELGFGSLANADLPTLVQLQEKQRNELLEIAQVRYGIKGSKVDIRLTPLKIDASMNEAQVFKVLLSAPEHERADQVLYELAKGNLDGAMANRILSSLALLGQFKKITVEG